MRRAALAVATLAGLAVGACQPEADRRAPPHARLTFPPLRAFTPPEPRRHVLDNGIVVYLLEDPTLPVVDLVGTVRAGSVWEPADKIGLASLCGQVIRTGGSTAHPGDALDARLESMGASLSVSIGEESGSFSLGCLSEDVDALLPVLADVLRAPAFPENKIALAKNHMLTGIARRNDDPEEMAGRLFAQVLYRRDSPYARQPETWTVAAITRQDLVDFHARFFHPEAVMIGVTGDFDAERMLARLSETFGAWPRGNVPPPEPPGVQPEPAATVNLVSRPDLNQATILLGHHGIVRRADDPDFFALVVMNDILGGGGFGSRLMQEVRTREGLAYAVGSAYGAAYTHPGLFQTFCQTKNASAVRAIGLIRDEIRRMTEEPVSHEELRTSKESILNAMVFEYDTRQEIVTRRLRYDYYGFPADYVERFQRGVAAVSAEDVLRVARRYLRPDNLTILVAGNPEAFDAPLSNLGPVTNLSPETPPPAGPSD